MPDPESYGPHIRVELVDGTNTWVSVAPVRVDQWLPDQLNYAAEQAAGEAFASFIGNLARDREVVTEHLGRFRKNG